MEKQYTLPKEFGEKWVRALKSGEYKQTTQKLCNGNSHYCCIGVAGIILGIPEYKLIRNSGKKLTPGIFGVEIPFVIKTGHRDLQGELITLNDYSNKTFPEIADWIETNVNFI